MVLVWGLVLTIGIQLLIGILASKRVRTEGEFLLAGRRLRTPFASASIFATWFGAETCIGAAGTAHAEGVGWHSVEPFAYGFCLILMGVLFAAPLWRSGIATLADLFRGRFSPAIERLAAVLLIPSSVLWAAAQVRAFGHVLSTGTGISMEVAIVVAALVAIVYTGMGGILADVWTDVVQAVVLAAGLVVVLGSVVAAQGGWSAVFAGLDGSRVSLETPPPGGWLPTLERWVVPIAGSVLAQEAISRSLASRSPSVARRSALIGGAAYLVFGSIPLFLGLTSVGMFPDLPDSEQVLPRLAREQLSTVAYVIFSAALVSAILSTVDSTLLAAASLFERNLVFGSRADVSDARRLRWARGGVVLFGFAALGLAWVVDHVSELVEHASGFASAGVLVAVVFGLFTRLGGARSALAALIAGGAGWIGGAYVLELELPYLLSLAMALSAYLAVAVVDRGPSAAARS